jgi:hypothetical protein
MERKSPALQEVPEIELIVTGIVERRCFPIGLKRDDMNIERQQDGDAQYHDPNKELAHSRSRSIKFFSRTHRRPGFLDQPRQGIHDPADSRSIQSASGIRDGTAHGPELWADPKDQCRRNRVVPLNRAAR